MQSIVLQQQARIAQLETRIAELESLQMPQFRCNRKSRGWKLTCRLGTLRFSSIYVIRVLDCRSLNRCCMTFSGYSDLQRICFSRGDEVYSVLIGTAELSCTAGFYQAILASLERALANVEASIIEPARTNFLKNAHSLYLRQMFMSPLTVGTALLHWPVESQ